MYFWCYNYFPSKYCAIRKRNSINPDTANLPGAGWSMRLRDQKSRWSCRAQQGKIFLPCRWESHTPAAMSAHDQMRAMLDQLMGTSRNGEWGRVWCLPGWAGRGQGGAARPEDGRAVLLLRWWWWWWWVLKSRGTPPCEGHSCVLDGVLGAPPTHSRLALRYKSLIPGILILWNMAWREDIEGFSSVQCIFGVGRQYGPVRFSLVTSGQISSLFRRSIYFFTSRCVAINGGCRCIKEFGYEEF